MTLRELFKTIDKKEWIFVAKMTLAVMVITSLPYLYGYFVTSPDKFYTGIHALSPGDQYVYYSYIEQIKQGHFLFKDLYTTEDQSRTIFNVLWLGVGLLARIFNLSNILAFHLARVLLIPIFVLVIYLLLAYFFRERLKRQLGLVFMLFSSGLGGILVNYLIKIVYDSYGYYHWPMDLWVPEANIFLTLYQSPHFIASLTLIVLIFLLFLLIFDSPQKKVRLKYSCLAGFLGLILFQFHPFHVPLIFGVLAAYLIVEGVRQFSKLKLLIKPFLIFSLISLPSILAHFLLLKYDPLAWQRMIQNICLTPAWWLVIISYGFLGPLVLFSFFRQNIHNKKYLFLIIWLIIQIYLIFSPLSFQRRLTEGLQIPLVIFALEGLFYLYRQLKEKINPRLFSILVANRYVWVFLFILLFVFSNIFNVARDFYFYKGQNIFHWPRDYYEAFFWLKNNTPEESKIFSHQTTGNLLPGSSGRIVYLGHEGVETLFFHPKKAIVQDFFFDNLRDEAKEIFLANAKIDYLFYSDFEKSLGDFRPEEKSYLEKVYQNKEVKIYEVKK